MRVAKALIYDVHGRLLVLRRSGTHPRHAHKPDLPGGIIEPAEDFATGLVREIKEETDLEAKPEDLELISRTKNHGLSEWRLYTLRLPNSPDVTISWEHESYAWTQPALSGLEHSDSFSVFASDYIT